MMTLGPYTANYLTLALLLSIAISCFITGGTTDNDTGVAALIIAVLLAIALFCIHFVG